jgi:hypothetical protein
MVRLPRRVIATICSLENGARTGSLLAPCALGVRRPRRIIVTKTERTADFYYRQRALRLLKEAEAAPTVAKQVAYLEMAIMWIGLAQRAIKPKADIKQR